MINFLVQPKIQFFDNNGDPLNGGKVFIYLPGTSTKTNSYPTLADAIASTNANTNPVILDSRGEANIVVNRTVKVVISPSTDTDPPTSSINTVDNWVLLTPIFTGTLGNRVLTLTDTNNAVNYLDLQNSATGNNLTFTAVGTDTDIGIDFILKNSGKFRLLNSGTGAVRLDAIQVSNGAFVNLNIASSSLALLADQPIQDSSGNNFLAFTKAVTAVNYLALKNAATGTFPGFVATGSNSDIGIDLYAKGSAGINLVGTSSAITNWYNVTDLTKVLVHNIAAVSATRTVTWPDSNVTILTGAATSSDQETATSTTTAVTPAIQQRHPSAAKAWILYTAVSSTTITVSYNVTSVTDNGSGDTTITFTTAFSSANYVCAGMAYENSGAVVTVEGRADGRSASADRLKSVSGGSFADLIVSACWFGDQ